MKVTEEYFQRLAHSSDSLSAVHELDGLWCARAGPTTSDLPQELSEPEHNVHLCLIYLAEVGSGGHSQFFLNPSGALSLETVEALRTLELGDLAAALAKASMVFPNGVVPRDHDVRAESMRQMDESEIARWDPLDQIVDRSEPWDRLLSYVREHQDSILVKERA